ncbi:MAG: MaoC family dehydratase [Chloroflexi bacterium]|nr:MAG: MaoC family dehydratase [Chloroflexota bacterium]
MSDADTDFRARAIVVRKGNRYEDMTAGRVFEHHWGRTISAGDNAAFTTQTLSFCPLYFNEPYAKALGHPRILVNPLLVFNTVFGLSVEDLSEGGGPFLGVDDCQFLTDVYIGDTLTARSTVISRRTSKTQPGFGIVTWQTQGFNQNNVQVIDFHRTNLVRRSKS